jgi:hypothetical protein
MELGPSTPRSIRIMQAGSQIHANFGPPTGWDVAKGEYAGKNLLVSE